ncbi:hypothetical protein ACETIH_03115 [Microvirga arabica]|uniref:Uncharacterized protein n=1 Tax=Microvirga arabica TaxID=1128671 RepID=A0ABV6Y369_9HYPH
MSLKTGLFAVLLFVGFQLTTQAHDIYSPLRDKAGRNCCDDGDCRPAPYRVRPTGVQMFVEGKWIWVPDHTIQYRALPGDTGETDGGHWCGKFENGPGYDLGYATYCAILPPNPTAISEPAFALHEGQIGTVP